MPTATTASRPRFRTDLVAEPIDEDGQRYIDVIDPDTGNGFRFYEVEYSLACAMDGERDVAGLMTWAHEELGITPTSSELASVIATLGDLGYLELGAPDVAVGPGVVVPAATPARPSIDVELGSPGATQPGRAGAMDKVPQVDDLMLGAAGTAAPTATGAAKPATADLLGPAGAGRVDLSADLAVGAADVKEAVRASKVIKSAELPKDLQAALATADEPITPRVKAPEPIKAPVAPIAPPVTAKEPPRPAKEPTRPPVTAKEPPRVKHPTVPPPDTTRTSPVLIFLLVLVILGAGGFAFWKYYWVPRQKTPEATSTKPVPVVTDVTDGSGSAAIKPEAPPPPLSAVLSISTPAPLDIQSPLAGAVASIAADGATVNQGDEIARIAGAEKVAAQLKDLIGDITRVQTQLGKLTKQREDATGDTGKLDDQIKDRTDSLSKKQDDKAKLEAEVEKRVIRAPAAGTMKPVATKGKKVAANDVIASIQPTGAPTATFEPLRENQKFTADQAITLNIEGAAEGQPQTIACKVVEVDAAKLVVECPDGAPDGTKVFLP